MSDSIKIKDRKGNLLGEISVDLEDKNWTIKRLKKEIEKLKKIEPIR